MEDLLGTQYESPLLEVTASTLLGSVEFVKQISETHLNALKHDRSVPAVRALKGTLSIVDIVGDCSG